MNTRSKSTKIIAIVMVFIFAFSLFGMSFAAFAEDENEGRLTITKEANGEQFSPKDTVTYTIEATQTNPDAVSYDIMVTDKLPSGLVLLDATLDGVEGTIDITSEQKAIENDNEKSYISDNMTEDEWIENAQSWLEIAPFSYSGLVERLIADGFSDDAATFAVKNCGADWNEQALLSAEEWLSMLPFSYDGLVERLINDGFKEDEAIYAANNCGVDWNEQALLGAQQWMEITDYTYEDLIDRLTEDGYTDEQATYGADVIFGHIEMTEAESDSSDSDDSNLESEMKNSKTTENSDDTVDEDMNINTDSEVSNDNDNTDVSEDTDVADDSDANNETDDNNDMTDDADNSDNSLEININDSVIDEENVEDGITESTDVEISEHPVSMSVMNDDDTENGTENILPVIETQIIKKDTDLNNVTVNGDIYVMEGATLTTDGQVTVNGNVYVFGTWENNGETLIFGTLHCLSYMGLSMFDEDEYDFGSVDNIGVIHVDGLNITNSWLDIEVPSDDTNDSEDVSDDNGDTDDKTETDSENGAKVDEDEDLESDDTDKTDVGDNSNDSEEINDDDTEETEDIGDESDKNIDNKESEEPDDSDNSEVNEDTNENKTTDNSDKNVNENNDVNENIDDTDNADVEDENNTSDTEDVENKDDSIENQYAAYSRAMDYMENETFSYEGLIKQLESDGFTHAEAVYAADNCGADWLVQAMTTAKNYVESTAYSYSALLQQLLDEGYTEEEAIYAVNNCGANWISEAMEKATNALNAMALSYTGLINQLTFAGFTEEDATYVADNCGADWFDEAARQAANYIDLLEYDDFETLVIQLEYEGFTEEQALYGASCWFDTRSTVTVNIPELAYDETAVITIKAVVGGLVSEGFVTNTVHITDADGNADDDSATIEIVSVPTDSVIDPDIDLTDPTAIKSVEIEDGMNGDFEDDGKEILVGDQLVYRITYWSGNSEDTSVTITDELDNGLTFEYTDDDSIYDEDTHTVTWVINDVESETEYNVFITTTVNTNAFDKASVLNTATVYFDDETFIETNTIENALESDIVSIGSDNEVINTDVIQTNDTSNLLLISVFAYMAIGSLAVLGIMKKHSKVA